MKDAPDVSAIRVFVAVAQTGSFSAGARAVGITRSAAGKALVRLEDRLGTRLLHRTTRVVALTVEGQTFFDSCSQILADLEEAEAAVRHDRPEPAGVLRLTLPDTFGRRHVLPLLNTFLKRWPKLNAEVSLTDHFVDILGEGYDLAVRCGGQLSDTRMVARVVARSDTVVCASPDYLAKNGEPRTADDLRGHDRLTLGNTETVRAWQLAPPRGPTLRLGKIGRLHLDSGVAIREAALEGLGVAYLPDFLVAQDIADGRLLPLLADHETERLVINAVYPHRRHLSAKVRLFVDQLAIDLRSLTTSRAGSASAARRTSGLAKCSARRERLD